jgi:uncharacterized membrane protein (UPF0127 family)
VIVLVGAFLLFYRPMTTEPTPTANPGLATTTLTVGNTTITVEVADTDAEREQGLSDRTSLAPGHGMLFVFQQDGDYGFWMKDMSFPLDMLFISETQTPNVGAVVSVAANASPDSYNAADPNASQVFSPPLAVKYVLEVPAGFAAEHGIATGTVVRIGK